jgi:peroxiredoxin (alkyl hydroperoxide reductase subunit C)
VIEPGVQAPDFRLPDHRGEERSLADFAERRLVICFYPNDFSPVCTDQLAAYAPIAGEVEAAGAELIGVSVDHSWAHRAFRKQLGIPFTLLADFHPKGEMATAYGAYLPDWGTTNRSVVVVEPDGLVSWVDPEETPVTFAPPERILEVLAGPG